MNKKLDYTPKPTYHLTMHSRDPYLLTDSRIDKSLWYEKYREKTVRWSCASLVEIIIDLGRICNVGNVDFYTVDCGSSGAQNPDKNCFPEAIVPSKRWQQWRQGIEDAVCLMGNKDLLDEFFQKPGSQLTSKYLTSLRKRADEKINNH